MEQVCRACMTSSVALVDIFADQREPCLASMLNECVDCEIKMEDQLPKKICLACIVEVQAAFGFKRKCEESYRVLSAKLIKNYVEVECDTLEEALKEEPTEEEPEEFIATKEKQNEYNFAEEPYADGPEEVMPSSSDVNVQSELINMESWELAKENVDLDYVKFEENADLSTESENTEESSTTVEVSAPNLENESSSQGNQFRCPHCSLDFSRSSHLNAHIRTHTGEQPFECCYCYKTFSHAGNLRKHVGTHAGERSFQPGKIIYKCPHCPLFFMKHEELEDHKRYHTGERTYRCRFCSKEFGYACHLEKHMRTHTGENSIQCPQCPKFLKKGNLERHLRSHTVRPHKCPQCPMDFNRAAHLKKHINAHRKEKL